jgi:asparagine synthase (glutamine-hydrolysing)
MCGVAGVIGLIEESSRAALRRMSDAMVHRGPDGQGIWESEPDSAGRGVLLAHRRLAILDLSPAGAQPMSDERTGNVLVFNGEIYNYLELRDRLSAAGETFASTGDTAVLLRLLGRQSTAAVRSLRGMFAFALWEPSRERLLLARDPLGIKPLYVARNDRRGARWSIAFASELRALLASGLLEAPRLNPQAVASVLWNGFTVGPETAVKGIELLMPGHLVAFDRSGAEVRSETFWSIPGEPSGGTMDEAELEAVLENGVRQHLASDVPLAVFLSGGIDSSAVAHLAQRANRAPIHTFTLAFEEPELNEGPAARRIASAIGTRHREVPLTEAHFVDRLERAIDCLDQPTFDALNAWYMSEAIRQAGFTVALVGTGGDELFGGYNSFRDLPVLHRWSRRLHWLPRDLLVAVVRLATSALVRSRAPMPPQSRWAKLPEMVRRGDDLLALYQLAYSLFLASSRRQLLARDLGDELMDGLPRPMLERLAVETRSRSPLSALSVMEQRIFLGERLLRDNDAASMAASIEQRLPLVDQVLFEAVDRVPDAVRYDPVGRKSLLRRVGLRGLDPALFDRPKSGFVLPYDRWIRRGLRETMDRTLRDPEAVAPAGLDPDAVQRLWTAFLQGARGVNWARVWAVYVLVRWCHRHRVLR